MARADFFREKQISQDRKDLFGNPWVEPKDPRGRKRHKRDVETAEKVGVLKACGTPTEVIAMRLGLSEPTLRKYYFRELQHGAIIAQAVLAEAMWEKAKTGVASAARYMSEQFEKGAVERIAKPESVAKPVPLGKKQEAQEAAERVGGRFATPEPPRTVQ